MEEGGTEIIRLPPMSPNLNAYAERFVRSIKNECLRRMIFIGQASLRRAIGEYMAHYHEGRNHQGVENRLIRPVPPIRMPMKGSPTHQWVAWHVLATVLHHAVPRGGYNSVDRVK